MVVAESCYNALIVTVHHNFVTIESNFHYNLVAVLSVVMILLQLRHNSVTISNIITGCLNAFKLLSRYCNSLPQFTLSQSCHKSNTLSLQFCDGFVSCYKLVTILLQCTILSQSVTMTSHFCPDIMTFYHNSLCHNLVTCVSDTLSLQFCHGFVCCYNLVTIYNIVTVCHNDVTLLSRYYDSLSQYTFVAIWLQFNNTFVITSHFIHSALCFTLDIIGHSFVSFLLHFLSQFVTIL